MFVQNVTNYIFALFDLVLTDFERGTISINILYLWLVYAYAGTSAVSIYLSIEQLMENSLHKLNANSFLVRAFFLISNTIHLLFDSEKLDSVNSLEIVTFSSECHVICSTHIVTSFSIA